MWGHCHPGGQRVGVCGQWVGVCGQRVGVGVQRVGVCVQGVDVCVRRVGVYHWSGLRGCSRLHIDDVDDGGFVPPVIQFAEHLAPGAAEAETRSGDVLAERALPKVRHACFESAPCSFGISSACGKP